MTLKPHLDYTTNYDTGTDAVTAIQPVINGEAASQGVFRRPSENLRGRSEKLRQAIDELIYFRDRQTYLLQCAGSGLLTWDGTVAEGGSGAVNNTTALTVFPSSNPVANVKGVIGIGTAGTNRVNYTVQATAYATHGVNRWRVEHRHVAAQGTIIVYIGDAPNRLILVTFDNTNAAHDAFAIATAVNVAVAAVSDMNGKILAAANATAGLPGEDSGGAVTFFDGVVSATISGTPTVDVETHLIPAGALGTLTGVTPLVEGSTIVITYAELIEGAVAADPDDPKGALLLGGRAESNTARANTDVTANLRILTGAAADGLHLSGCIPLVKIVNNTARWLDGTAVAAGSSSTPGGLGYPGGPDWADATTNPATSTLAAQITKMLTDLGGTDGAMKIGADALPTWPTGSANPAGPLFESIEKLVEDLISQTATSSGSRQIGVEARAAWPSGTTNPATYVYQALAKIITDLVSQAANHSGARQVGVEARSAWPSGTTNPATYVYQALEKLITDLAAQTPNHSGARQVGVDARSTWAGGGTNPATSVYAALDKIITDLGATGGLGSSGGRKIGVEARGNWADSTTNPATYVFQALDKIVADLASTTGQRGAGKVTAPAASSTKQLVQQLPASRLDQQLEALLNRIETEKLLRHKQRAMTMLPGSVTTATHWMVDFAAPDSVGVASRGRVELGLSAGSPSTLEAEVHTNLYWSSGADTWTGKTLASAPNYFLRGMYAYASSTVIVGSQDGVSGAFIQACISNSTTFANQTVPSNLTAASDFAADVIYAGGRWVVAGYKVGSGGRSVHTTAIDGVGGWTNGGNMSATTATPWSLAYAPDMSPSAILVSANYGTVPSASWSVDGGTNWTEVPVGPSGAGVCIRTGVAWDPANRKFVLFQSSSGYETRFYNSDDGKVWTLVNTISNTMLQGIACDEAGTVLVAGFFGDTSPDTYVIGVSQDAGGTVEFDGMTTANVSVPPRVDISLTDPIHAVRYAAGRFYVYAPYPGTFFFTPATYGGMVA